MRVLKLISMESENNNATTIVIVANLEIIKNKSASNT